jgi:hypothetical protein
MMVYADDVKITDENTYATLAASKQFVVNVNAYKTKYKIMYLHGMQDKISN